VGRHAAVGLFTEEAAQKGSSKNGLGKGLLFTLAFFTEEMLTNGGSRLLGDGDKRLRGYATKFSDRLDSGWCGHRHRLGHPRVRRW